MGTINKAVNLIKSFAHLYEDIYVSRRERRSFNRGEEKHNNDKYKYGGGLTWNGQAIYRPKRTKLKGWQKENRRSSFNKKRRAA